jgi:fatty acid desaturase
MLIASQSSKTTSFRYRYRDGIVFNLAALAYTVFGWFAGIGLITSAGPVSVICGVLLIAHTLTTSAYLIHECEHGTIFARARDNDRLGSALAWMSGACIAPYAGLKEKHLRHHADRLDVVSFDYRASLQAAPTWWRNTILVLEYLYIPAVEYLMRGLIIRHRWALGGAARRSLVMVLATRAAAFALLGLASPLALPAYAVAYAIFLHILRFQDAFQHTFDVYHAPDLAAAPPELVRDRAYEHENTYSDVVSADHPWLNLLVLNFAYHNAHHAKPAEPWYRLARLHRKLYADDRTQVLPVRTLLASYHHHRVARVMAAHYGEVAPTGDRAHGFLGAVGVSFLTAS